MERNPPKADVCLVMEGGYPYVTGGVSVWVDQLTRGLPDVTFAVAHVHEEVQQPRPGAYQPAPNVGEIVELSIERGREHLPSELAERLPEASVYHACITGFASDAASIAAARRNAPLVVTEHGLAWREAGWIHGCNPGWGGGGGGGQQGGQQGGNSQGAALSPLERKRRCHRLRRQASDAYRRASVITSVCSANVRDQRRLGARPTDSLVIPNCVAAVAARTTEHGSPRRLHVGFVGRVVPIKDVHTLIRAAAHAARSIEIRLSLVGPLDHDPEYVSRCRALARNLGLPVEFVGEVDPHSWYPRFDVVALTSVSEAQPLALLEAMAAGVPVLATSVGGCPELVEAPLRGARVGPAGLLVAARHPGATAQALVRLAADPALRTRLGLNGYERTRRRHTSTGVWGAYRRMYERVAA